eukprot:gene8564-8746_t
MLGARVAAARQFMEPNISSSASAALIPHLRNKGLILFRSQVLLSYQMRRPLQQAALWLCATEHAGPAHWGGDNDGLTEQQLELLTAARKLLRELDVTDDGSDASTAHTHAKLRRCFGRLLVRSERRGGKTRG